jgi:hypothetical protein
MPDTTYPPGRVYSRATDGALVVPDGATIAVESGGAIVLASGGTLTDDAGGVVTAEIADLGVTTGKLAASAVTAAKIADATITSAKLANGAGLTSLITAGLGASAPYTKAATGANTLLAADPTHDRAVLIVVTVDEVFADGSGGQTTFKVGETSTTAKFADTTAFADAAAGTVLVYAGILLATKALLVTAVAATGTGTGGISVSVLALNSS